MSSDPLEAQRRRARLTQQGELRDVESSDRLIGNTPLVALRHVGDRSKAPIYVKLENLNPSGSMRDRYMAEILQRSGEAGVMLAGAARGATRLAGRQGPETFRAGSVAARYRPLHFRNDAAKAALDWAPGARFSATFRAS